MKVLYIEPFKHPRVVDISLDGPDFKNLVHGDYSSSLVMRNVELVANDIGKLIGLTPNRLVGNDLVCGPFFFAGSGKDAMGNYDYIDLSTDHINLLTDIFYVPLSPVECQIYAEIARQWIKPEMINYHNRKYPQFKVER